MEKTINTRALEKSDKSTHSKPIELSDLRQLHEVKSWVAISGAFKTIFNNIESELLKSGCSYPRFLIMQALYFEGPHSGIELSKKLDVTRGNISMFIKRILKDKIINEAKRFGTTARPKYKLTHKGKKLFEKSFLSYVDSIKNVLDGFSHSTLSELGQTGQSSASVIH